MNVIKTLRIAIAITLLSNVSYGQIRPANFTGSWKLNVSKSEFGDIPQYAAVKQYDVRQDADSVFIKRIVVDQNNAEKNVDESISLDGKPTVHELANKKKRISVITWSDDKKTMTTKSSYTVANDPDEIEYSVIQSWIISEDNSLRVTFKGYDLTDKKNFTIKLIYDKQ
jgi:hypothetical protein